MARRARCWRVRGTVTQKVDASQAVSVNIHAVLLKDASGQLRFLGSIVGAAILIGHQALRRFAARRSAARADRDLSGDGLAARQQNPKLTALLVSWAMSKRCIGAP